MKLLSRVPSFLALSLASSAVLFAQNEPVILEAESGVVGSQFAILSDGATQYAAIQSTVGGFNPATSDRVIGFTVNFPSEGAYELYARLRVGPATFNDDSMFYGNGLGAKNPTADADWILANGLAATVGFTAPADKVVGGGLAQSNVWKWVKLSAFDGGEPPVAVFNVPAGGLTQTFQVAGREDGLWLDKFAFGRQGVFYTVFDLDNGLPGTTEPPPPPYVPPVDPIAFGKPKFLGGVSSPAQNLNFNAYFNQVTPENGGKWGSVEGARDVMSWGQLDTAYNLAKNNTLPGPNPGDPPVPYPLPFRMHTLVWGNQQPGWIESLSTAEQREEIEEWFAAVAARYPGIDHIDVVNEPLHDPPAGPGNGNYIEALGGPGATGWDWVIEAFRLARQHFPNAQLGINEFSVTNNTTDMMRYIQIVNLLKAENLIDTVGVQGHAFSTRPNIPMSTHVANLNLLAATGLPIYVTELDIDGPTDEVQLADYQRIFPVFWEHPGVRGITLWGYRPGHWRTAQGAYIVHEQGAERPAMVWLKGYVENAVLPPWITAEPESLTATVEDTVSFTVAGDGTGPLSYAWRKNGAPISGNASAATPTLTLPDIVTADAGSYDCVVSNAAGSATSATAVLTVMKALASVSFVDLVLPYDGTPRSVMVATMPPGLALEVTYDGSLTPPTAPGSYTVAAVVQDADYFGGAVGTLQVTTTALVRHGVSLNGAVAGSVQVLLAEDSTLNGGASVSSDLLVRGTPLVRLNGQVSYGGTLEGGGNALPSNYAITLNGGATLRHVVRRTDAVSFPTSSPPPAPAGTRDVVLNTPGESPGDFATLRNLTLDGAFGQLAVPAGTYGNFIANGGSGFTLGEAGATEPAVYNFHGLTLNGGSALVVVGPVIVKVGTSVVVSGSAGVPGNPEWLTLQVPSGDVILNGNVTLNGFVVAPAGTVMINGALNGGVISDRLTINGGGVLTGTEQ
jgi:endo-1,4-beta-xylanase